MLLVDPSGKVVDVNLKACKQFGFDKSKMVGRSFGSFVVAKALRKKFSGPAKGKVHVRSLGPCTLRKNGGKTYRAVLSIRSAEGRSFRISITPLGPTPPIKRTLPVPARIGDAFTLLYSNSARSVIVLDRNNIVVCANSRWTENFSNPSMPVLGSSLDDIWPLQTHCATSLKKLIVEVARTRQAIHLDGRSVTFVHQPGRGTTYWDWDIEPIIDDSGEVEYLVFTSTEVTDRKHLEEETQRNNMALRAVVDCSRILLRSSDESAMIAAVCSKLKETGGCQLVWFGVPDEDHHETMRPVAVSGTDSSMTSEWDRAWTVSQSPEGPLSRALAQRRTMQVRNSGGDPADADWQEEMQKRGLQTSLCLPVICGDELLGILALFSMSATSFQAEEIRLLEELAENLAYRMSILRINADTALHR